MLKQAFHDWRRWVIRFLLNPYFIFWAKRLIKRWRPRTIVITGSSGKTTLLNMLKVQLGKDGVAYSTRANSNIGVVCNLVGVTGVTGSSWRWLTLLLIVPWQALTVKRTESIYVVEFDIDRPEAKNNIIAALKPEVCFLTNVVNSHLEKFDRPARKAGQSSLELMTSYQLQVVCLARRIIYLPASQRDQLAELLLPTEAEVAWIDSQLTDYEVTARSTLARIGRRRFRFAQPQPRQIGQQLHFMIALAEHLKLRPKTDLRDMITMPGRSTSLRGRRGSWLIDSSYNSNPSSMAAVLEMVSQIQAPVRWAVIGDYLELGRQGPAAHRQLAGWLAEAGFDRLFLYGRRLETDAWPILNGIKEVAGKSQIYQSAADLLDDLESELTGREVILFKGAGFLEHLVEALLDDPADVALLCRREPRFARQRASFLAQQTKRAEVV